MTVAVNCDDLDKPRVISEVRKNRRRVPPFTATQQDARPKISGELLWSATPTQWHVKLAEVRQGSLVVHCCASGAVEFRLPLHHLNITAGHTPRTFVLATTQGIPLASFQTLTEEEYQRWVRVLAVEVLRQTPLQDVRFLDIIGITRGGGGQLRRGQSEECLARDHIQLQQKKYKQDDVIKKKTEFSQWLNCVKRETEEENRAKNTDFDMKNMKIRRAQKTRPKLPFADTWSKLKGDCEPVITSLHPPVTPRRSISMDNLSKTQTQRLVTQCGCVEEKPVSDESGISSGDENNNILSDIVTKSDQSKAEAIYVSVREKKNFFESLGSIQIKRQEGMVLNRSNSIGHFDVGLQKPNTLLIVQRATSMQDLSGNASPVRQMARLFESGSTTDLTKNDSKSFDTLNPKSEQNQKQGFVNPMMRKPRETVNYANIQFCRNQSKICRLSDRGSIPPKIILEENESEQQQSPNQSDSEPSRLNTYENVERPRSVGSESSGRSSMNEAPSSGMPPVLIQRKLQRGERKLTKLRIQIADVEETIRNIAEDLQSLGPNTLKKRSGLEVFAALRRRLEEESSRLERLQEETAKVISDNQRTILKMTPPQINHQ